MSRHAAHKIRELQKRISELEEHNHKTEQQLATARALLAATWPGEVIPEKPAPVELTHALRGLGHRQAVHLDVDGVHVIAGVRGAGGRSDTAREAAVWAAIVDFARRGGERAA